MALPIFLCADDYALTDGVSRGIEELAAARRLSGTSALVTTQHWLASERRVADLSRHIAVGLHLNFALGAPLGAMRLAPEERLPPIGALIRSALTGRVDPADVAAEVERQIVRFRDVAGRLPDFVDGHQHAHALPGMRTGVLRAVRKVYGSHHVLIRDPADEIGRIIRRQSAVAKSLVLAFLSAGFGASARAAGLETNDGFSGVSSFSREIPFDRELSTFFTAPGPRHLVMCHPGHPDPELSTLDPVVERRADELAALSTYPGLPNLIWHPGTTHDGLAWGSPLREAAA